MRPRRKVDTMRHGKIMTQWPRFPAWPAATALALCLGIGTVHSQDATQTSPTLPANAPQGTQPSTAPPTATTSAPETQVPVAANSPVLIVDMRPELDIQADLDDARALKPKALAAEQKSGVDVIQSKTTLEIEKKDLSALKSKIESTKKAGNAAEAATLDRQRQEKELDIKLLERLVAVRESQVELAVARRKFADASTIALESELEMGKKRTGWDSLTQPGATGGSPQNIVALQVSIRSDELRVLQAMKERSVKSEELAKKESALIERQIGVLQADTEIQQFATRAH